LFFVSESHLDVQATRGVPAPPGEDLRDQSRVIAAPAPAAAKGVKAGRERKELTPLSGFSKQDRVTQDTPSFCALSLHKVFDFCAARIPTFRPRPPSMALSSACPASATGSRSGSALLATLGRSPRAFRDDVLRYSLCALDVPGRVPELDPFSGGYPQPRPGGPIRRNPHPE
jgi:hypothetical protein